LLKKGKENVMQVGRYLRLVVLKR